MLCLALGMAATTAQAAYPDRPITLVVPFAAGSGSDLVARIVAKGLTNTLQATVVVDNKPGANGSLGAQKVARAKPDGYTLLLGGTTTHAVNYALLAGRAGYASTAFDFVGHLGATDVFLLVPSAQAWKNIADLANDARQRPGVFSCGSGNAVTQVACEYFQQTVGIGGVTAPYKSTPQSLADLAGGQLSFAFADATVAHTFLATGKLRAIAVAARQRNAAAPDVATFQEQGVKGFEFSTWAAVFAPAGTPRAITSRLNVALVAISDAPEMARLRSKTGSAATPMDLSEGERFVRHEIQRWNHYVTQTGVKSAP